MGGWREREERGEIGKEWSRGRKEFRMEVAALALK